LNLGRELFHKIKFTSPLVRSWDLEGLKAHFGPDVTGRVCVEEEEYEGDISLGDFMAKYGKLDEYMYLIDFEVGKPPTYPTEWVWSLTGTEIEVIFIYFFVFCFWFSHLVFFYACLCLFLIFD